VAEGREEACRKPVGIWEGENKRRPRNAGVFDVFFVKETTQEKRVEIENTRRVTRSKKGRGVGRIFVKEVGAGARWTELTRESANVTEVST